MFPALANSQHNGEASFEQISNKLKLLSLRDGKRNKSTKRAQTAGRTN
jgi:hypothetical protein